MPAPLEELTCPTCGRGPFGTRQALGAHSATHMRITCPVCGKETSASGAGNHRASHDRAARPRPPRPERAELDTAPDEILAVQQLLGRLETPGGVARIWQLVKSLHDLPDVEAAGEVRAPLGADDHERGAREACVVLPLALAAEVAKRESQRLEMAALR